jgi:hypothetical protein
MPMHKRTVVAFILLFAISVNGGKRKEIEDDEAIYEEQNESNCSNKKIVS